MINVLSDKRTQGVDYYDPSNLYVSMRVTEYNTKSVKVQGSDLRSILLGITFHHVI